jgi:hypothetical protein
VIDRTRAYRLEPRVKQRERALQAMRTVVQAFKLQIACRLVAIAGHRRCAADFRRRGRHSQKSCLPLRICQSACPCQPGANVGRSTLARGDSWPADQSLNGAVVPQLHLRKSSFTRVQRATEGSRILRCRGHYARSWYEARRCARIRPARVGRNAPERYSAGYVC